jgi:hypothetical protein
MKLVATLGLALGAATAVAGGLSFDFGLNSTGPVVVSGAGPFDGRWDPAAYCFLGTALAAVGTAVAVFCLTWTALFFRHGSASAPRRRWVLWALVLAVGVAGTGVGVTVLRAPRPAAPVNTESARLQVAIFLTRLSHGKPVQVMTTAGYQQRERDGARSVRYELATVRFTSTEVHDGGRITVTGTIAAVARMTSMRAGGGALVGAGLALEQFDPPRVIGFTARLVGGEGDLWLVDEIEFDDR